MNNKINGYGKTKWGKHIRLSTTAKYPIIYMIYILSDYYFIFIFKRIKRHN